MGVPKDIRDVPRPANTAVFDSGSNGPLRYSVHEHTGWKHPESGKPYCTFGGTIGHIINGKYVPIQDRGSAAIPDYAAYAVPALVRSVSEDILDDLLAVYPANEAFTIFNAAAVRVIRPRTPSGRLAKEYRMTFFSVYYPGAALSRNTVCTLLQDIGQDFGRLSRFYGLRLSRALGDHLAIDGMLRTDNSVINSLSEYSRKAKVKNSRDISLMYAFSTEKAEPVCVQPFPGNRPDTSAYVDFIRMNDIRDATIIDDTGFAVSSIREELKNRPNLHYLTSIRRNDTRIMNNGMLRFDHPLKGTKDPVIGHKVQIKKDGTFLYSFRNTTLSARELTGYVRNAQRKSDDIDPAEYAGKNDLAGVIVLESDLDASLETIYQMHASRWLIELSFKRYKHTLDITSTNVQDDYSVYGTELVNYISTVVTCRILKKAGEAGILDNMTYGDMMDSLSQAWRKTSAGTDMPESHDDKWLNPTNQDYEIMEALGICRAKPKTTRKRGRPRKNPIPEAGAEAEAVSPEPAAAGKGKGSGPSVPEEKVPDGNAQPAASTGTGQGTSDGAHDQPAVPVPSTEIKKKGRPRKYPLPDPDAPKRKPGRPRKYPPKDPDAPKRKPGRPRKYPPEDPDAPKRKPGRPRKYPPKDPDVPKRKPGRPRKYPPKDPNVPKRKPGRPKKDQAEG